MRALLALLWRHGWKRPIRGAGIYLPLAAEPGHTPGAACYVAYRSSHRKALRGLL